MKTNNSFLFGFLCVIICACSKDILDERHIEREDLVLTKVQTGYLESGNEFGLTLFKCLEDIDQTSQIISPLSLQVALGMLVAGADGDTAGEIVSALGFGENAAETMDYLSSLCRQLVLMDHQTDFLLANCLLFNSEYAPRILPDYIQSLCNLQNALVLIRSFDKEATSIMTEVNDWSSNHTGGRIPILINRASDLTGIEQVAVLINALYFNGKWVHPFERKNTGKDWFYPIGQDSFRVPFMHQKGYCGYYEDEEKQVLSMDYGNGAFSFLVILPCEGLAPSDISSHLNARSLDSIHMLMDETEVIISIPSFSLEKTVNLIPLLKKVGIDDAFSSGNASFGKMVDNKGVFVNGVNQRISFRIDERGSEATSVTTIDMGGGTAPPMNENKPKVFEANHPFLYMIIEKSSGSILFIGSYTGTV